MPSIVWCAKKTSLYLPCPYGKSGVEGRGGRGSDSLLSLDGKAKFLANVISSKSTGSFFILPDIGSLLILCKQNILGTIQHFVHCVQKC